MNNEERILIVDDDESTCRSLALIFGRKGYEFEIAQTGREALEKAQGRFFNLALLDIKLPDMEGVELLAPLKELHPDMVVIMITGYASLKTAVQALSEGASAYITKPVNMDEVLVTVREALEKQRLVWEKQRVEKALQASVQQWQTTFDAIGDAISLLDLEGKILRCNKAMTELLGKPFDEIIGRACYELLHGTSEPIVGCPIVRMRKTRQRETKVLPIGERWVRAVADPLLDEDGNLTGCVHAISDITERKWTREALQRRAAQLALLNDIGGKIAAVLELDSVLDRAAHLVQEGFGYHHVALFTIDHERGELVMRSRAGEFAPLYPPEHRLKLGQGMVGWVGRHGQTLLANDVDAEPRYINLYPNRIPTWSELSVPIRVGEEITGVLDVQSPQRNAFDENDVIVMETLADQIAVAIENARLYEQAQQEIAERKRAEAALEEERALLARRVAERTADLSAANAELARAARLKDEFLASMSHELRTPLNVILGMSEALQEQLYGPLSKKQRGSLRHIEESGHHLLSLINDILDVAKVGAGELELEIGPVSVGSVCQASLRLIQQAAHKKRLKVSPIFDSAVTTIQADARRLKQILVNLLDNAVKFTPEGGAIGLEVVGDAEGEVVHFIIWDTGIGISQEEMGRLFQPFVQLDSSLSRQYTGTGLGLVLVHRLTELHGGGVLVESKVGKGSRFTVSLPWRVPARSEAGPACPELGRGEPRRRVEGLAGAVEPISRQQLQQALGQIVLQKTEEASPFVATADQEPGTERPLILLAEDNESSIITILDYLLAQRYRVVVARDGAEAIARAREENPDLILMDIYMPGMDGLEATRHIRADADTSTGLSTGLADVPIIALTALAMPGDRERCLEAGANEYLSKPVSLKGLVKAIEAQMEQNDGEINE